MRPRMVDTIIQAALAGGAYFVYVFFKAFQQKNVAFDHRKWVLPTSYAMAFTEVITISLIAFNAAQGLSWTLILFAIALGTGGGLGALLAMSAHKRYVR